MTHLTPCELWPITCDTSPIKEQLQYCPPLVVPYSHICFRPKCQPPCLFWYTLTCSPQRMKGQQGLCCCQMELLYPRSSLGFLLGWINPGCSLPLYSLVLPSPGPFPPFSTPLSLPGSIAKHLGANLPRAATPSSTCIWLDHPIFRSCNNQTCLNVIWLMLNYRSLVDLFCCPLMCTASVLGPSALCPWPFCPWPLALLGLVTWPLVNE